MGFVLDATLKKKTMEDTEVVAGGVNEIKYSDNIDVSRVEDAMSIQLEYIQGIATGPEETFGATLSLEMTTNGQSWVQIPSSVQTVSDETGTHLWDIKDTGTVTLRVRVEVSQGSMLVKSVSFSGKRRH